jgi:putative sporulation protein YyaC
MNIKNRDELIQEIGRVIGNLNEVVFVCVGTDRSTGDSLGPLIGTQLVELGYTNIYGTLDDPVHAMNLQETIDNLPKDKTVIAIDSCLGQLSSVGTYQVKKGPLRAGAGVGKVLPPVGNHHITGIVNVGGFMEYFVLQNTRLSLVMKMAKDISESIHSFIERGETFEPLHEFERTKRNASSLSAS